MGADPRARPAVHRSAGHVDVAQHDIDRKIRLSTRSAVGIRYFDDM
jgi:hypothetical protein